MSSLRNAAKRITHKERSQPFSRKKLGFLEKKKDYKLRATDYHKKEKIIKNLKQKAANRNEDEYYFKMANTKTKDGKHEEELQEKFTKEEILLLQTQDISYLLNQKVSDLKKIEKLKANLHFSHEESNQNKKKKKKNNKNNFGDDMQKDSNENEQKAKHIVFVDNDDELKTFSAEKYFNTPSSLVTRSSNRLKNDQIESPDLVKVASTKNSKKLDEISSEDLLELHKVKRKNYNQLDFLQDRQKKLQLMSEEQSLRKNLMKKGRRVVIRDENGRKIFKWKPERKR